MHSDRPKLCPPLNVKPTNETNYRPRPFRRHRPNPSHFLCGSALELPILRFEAALADVDKGLDGLDARDLFELRLFELV